MNKTVQAIDSEVLRNRLKLKKLQVEKDFSLKFPEAHQFFKEKDFNLADLRKRSSQLLGAGVLTGALFLMSPNLNMKSLPSKTGTELKLQIPDVIKESRQKIILTQLSNFLPGKTRPLTNEEDKKVEQTLTANLGIKVKATLEGEHLNTTYGLIGAEQHLIRYPGDLVNKHGSGQILSEGIAPGLGAWGYFASSKDKLTPDLVQTERWYAVVQTLYLPSWNKRVNYLRDWYKYRKVIIVNTQNGNAVVAAIADSGPAAWTGKQFGGSPEVMDYLGGPRYKKGSVLVFFVDDPDNKVPLGPVEYNKINLPEVAVINI